MPRLKALLVTMRWRVKARRITFITQEMAASASASSATSKKSFVVLGLIKH